MARIVVCGVQTLYVRGGAEILVETLTEGLRSRGHQVDSVSLPFTDAPRSHLVFGFLAWRLQHIKSVHGRLTDLLIATKFPSYAARHHNKVVWLVHQHRQAYDLFGTRYSDMHARPDGRLFAWLVRGMDRWSLTEARRLYAISGNVASRLQRFNRLRAEPLYPPPKLASSLHAGEYGDYVLAVSRFEPIKRIELMLRAAALVEPPLRFVLVGGGLEQDRLARLAVELKLEGRVTFAGAVDDRTLVDLYAGCLGVVYPPYDEDYGYVTVEAFLCHKPVVSTSDAGGVLEFLEDGVNGYVAEPTPESLARALDRLWEGRARAGGLGAAGYERVRDITWDRVLDGLTGTLG